jgi:hypothetical protein
LSDLQSPVQLPDFDSKALSALTELWIKNSMSCDFLCFCLRRTFNFVPFIGAVNGSLTCHDAGERDSLPCDVVRRFPVADLGRSKWLRFVRVFGRGDSREAHIFQMTPLGVNDTFHCFVRPDVRQFADVPPRIVFVIRYLDAQM